MIKAKSLDELIASLSKAAVKAEKEKPAIKPTAEFGVYLIWSKSKRSFIEVRIGTSEDRMIFIACLCRGGLEGKACYHAAAVLHRHLVLMARERQNSNNAPYLKEIKEKKPENIGGIRI